MQRSSGSNTIVSQSLNAAIEMANAMPFGKEALQRLAPIRECIQLVTINGRP
jgi:hypothetical protein